MSFGSALAVTNEPKTTKRANFPSKPRADRDGSADQLLRDAGMSPDRSGPASPTVSHHARRVAGPHLR